MMPPYILQQIRFAVREATAFVGHSFADEDAQLIDQIKQFLSKLGVKRESGKRAEPKSISDKVKQRIQAAELFVGIFTRRQQQQDGSFSTSAWTIEGPPLSPQASVCCCSLKMVLPSSGVCKATTNTSHLSGTTWLRP